MHELILVINAGSSSIKFSVFETAADRSLTPRVHGEVAGIGTAPLFSAVDAQGRDLANESVSRNDHEGAIAAILGWYATQLGGEAALDGVGHRVVHGGLAYSQPVLIDDHVIAELEALVPLAPLHQPHHLAAIRAIKAVAPELPQVGCFDTGFHRSQPSIALQSAQQRDLTDQVSIP